MVFWQQNPDLSVIPNLQICPSVLRSRIPIMLCWTSYGPIFVPHLYASTYSYIDLMLLLLAATTEAPDGWLWATIVQYFFHIQNDNRLMFPLVYLATWIDIYSVFNSFHLSTQRFNICNSGYLRNGWTKQSQKGAYHMHLPLQPYIWKIKVVCAVVLF